MITNKQKLQQFEDKIKQLENNFSQVSAQKRDLEIALEMSKSTNNMQNLDLAFKSVAQAPVFDMNINDQFLQNGNYNTNFNIMVKQQSMGWGSGNIEDTNFLVYLLILQRAQYFKNRVKLYNADFVQKRLIENVFYYGALMGWVALTDKYELLSINELSQNGYVKGMTINISGATDFESKEVKTNKFVVFEFNESHFSLWILAWFYLNEVNNLFTKLSAQSRYLIKQLVVKVEQESIGARQDILKSNLWNEQTPFLVVNKDVELAPLDSPADNLTTIFNYLENFKNWFDFNLLKIVSKDITTDKERDVASQQSNFGNQNIIANNYLDSFVDNFLNEYNLLFGANITFEDPIIKQLEEQAKQSLTLAKQNDESEKESIDNE